MFSATEMIGSGLNSYYSRNHYNHRLDHGDSNFDLLHQPNHQHHLQEDPHVKFCSDGNRPRKSSIKTEDEDGQVNKFMRKKRPITEADELTVVSRVCADCRTSKTPLWRTGPAGPKSLCNACGIRYGKRRRGEFDVLEKRNGVATKEKKGYDEEEAEKVMFHLQRKFEGKEEAEAALLLMALSCGLCVH